MPKTTDIQWGHSSVNPVMGCEGCELYPTTGVLRTTLRSILRTHGVDRAEIRALVEQLTACGPQRFKLQLPALCRHLATVATNAVGGSAARALELELTGAASRLFICYASTLHRTFNANGRNPGYAAVFEEPRLVPGRVAKMARLGLPTPSEIEHKPWLTGYRRLIFLSDMGDALCRTVPFEFLQQEIVDVVLSEAGRRHVWLWLTKRPHRMAEFADWLAARGIVWPDNLVAMTSVTSDATVHRVKQLRRVPARYRALSVEPLWSDVELPLDGIDWVIVGGQSGAYARPFELGWARHILAQCREAGAAPFVKQLGATPLLDGQPLHLEDSHGGDWTEEGWPADLRVRELPVGWLGEDSSSTYREHLVAAHSAA